jgi:hypothetical protein
VGRKSREKRDRRRRLASQPVLAAIRPFTRSSLLPLLEAASVSPTAGHRLPSLSVVFQAVITRSGDGSRTASPDDLSTFVEAAQRQDPRIATMEDSVPYDPRLEVIARWRGNMYRLLPGALERPVAKLDRLHLLAAAIDPVLVRSIGYGLGDLAELVLRRVDSVAAALASVWLPGPMPDVGDPASLTQAEIDSAGSLAELRELVASCSNPERADRALTEFSVRRQDLIADVSHPDATFGPLLAVRAAANEIIPLPGGFLLEALEAAAGELARRAVQMEPSVDRRWEDLVANRIGDMLQASGHRIAGPVRLSDGSRMHSLITYTPRQVLALDVAASLAGSSMQDRVSAAGERLDRVRGGETFKTPGADIRVNQEAEVVRFLITAAPAGGPMALHGAHPMGTLEDVLWMARVAAKTPEDLWYFFRDWTNPPGVGRKFAWDLIDAWEFWWGNGKSFYRGGRPLTLLMLAPHAAEAEWAAAARWAELERALLRLGLPPVSAWPLLDEDPDWGFTVGHLSNDIVFHVLSLSAPVAVRATDQAGPPEQGGTLWGLAQGTAWKLGQARAAWERAAGASGLRAVRVEFSFHDRHQGPQLTLDEADDDGHLVIGWDVRLQEELLHDSNTVEASVGQLLASLIVQDERESFLEAWSGAPPGVRVDAATVRQRARKPISPIAPHDSLRSDAQRRIGEQLMTAGVSPSQYEGRDASKLETETIYPRLLKMLRERMQECDARALLLFALTQLERANHARIWREQKLAWHRGFPVQSFGPGADLEEARERDTTLVRAVSLVIEEMLAEPPAGSNQPDAYFWSDLLSVGELCLESATGSEAIHLNLTPTTVEVTDSFEIQVRTSDDPTDVDLRRYSDIRAVQTLPEPVPIGGSGEPPEEDADHEAPKPLVELMPELRDIDTAMRRAHGFGLDALTGLLISAQQWEVMDSEPVGVSDAASIVREAAELAVDGTSEEELHQALMWLSLHRDDLDDQPREHWEVERRPFRLATRPFVRSGSEVFVLPWSSEVALRTFANYLQDGRLPWPAHLFEEPVVKALERYRQRKNRSLEDECLSRLEDSDFVTGGPIKPEKAATFGFAELRGEIDALCIDPSRSRIWVLEAKDPYTPFSARQIRRLIIDFHEPDGYVDKLLGKVEDVRRDSESIAEALKVPTPNRQWEVIGLMVTRHADPAAFAMEPRVSFCTIDELRTVVNNPAPPRLGAQDS